jgi:hypothetical protein
VQNVAGCAPPLHALLLFLDGRCHPMQVKGLTIMVNSQYNGWRMEDVWLDR